MRQFRFRAWDGKRIRPHEDFEIAYDGIYEKTDFDSGVRCDWIVMQYTQLKDKNGKEIYEGDVVLHFGGGRWRVITYKHCGFISMRGELEIEIPKRSEDVEVIGNIHENPELVKEKTNAVNP